MKFFEAMSKGYGAAEKIKDNCIVLVGLSRVGKSTVHNWLRGVPLVGRLNEFGVLHYDAVSNNDIAEMSPEANSKTLIANVRVTDENTCIIDTAGFRDRRNHIGVFCVNFMLKVIFEKGKNFKFIIVISRSQIDLHKDVMDTFFHFINLFDWENLTP